METILDKEKMESVRALAETNIKISEARNTLSSLKSIENSYLADREAKALKIIAKVIDDSSSILKEAYANHEEIKSLSKTVSEFSSFLAEAHDKFRLLVTEFDQKNAVWNEVMRQKEEETTRIKQEIASDRVRIKNDQDSIRRREEILRQEKRKIDDERGTIERAIKRLREGKI